MIQRGSPHSPWVFDPEIQRKIAGQLFRMHQLKPEGLPSQSFFELLHGQWGDMARSVLGEYRGEFPPNEQLLCVDLEQFYEEETLAKVLRCLPDRPPVFCHNDTYHGNIMLLRSRHRRADWLLPGQCQLCHSSRTRS